MRLFFSLALVAGLSGCGTVLLIPEPPVTQTATARPDAFSCALSALTDLGYTIVDAERDVFVRAERRVEQSRLLSERYVHILTVAEVDGLLRVTADREVFGTGDESGVREPFGPNPDTLGDAETVLAACGAP
ncbi:MAG: hypothetical protein AAF624_02370 [Bacteroidota bacterium]